MMHVFDELIYPYKRNQFLKEMNLKPKVIRNGGRKYTNIFTIEDIDRMLTVESLRPPFIKLISGKRGQIVLPFMHYAERNIKVASPQIVLEEFINYQTTIVIQHVHLIHSVVSAFTKNIENTIYPYSIQSNAYLAPACSPGFPPHIDQHHTFLLQLSGSKRWLVWNKLPDYPDIPQIVYPDSDKKCLEISRTESPIIDEIINEGDVIFIPRGFIHTPYTNETHSLHITLGIVDPEVKYMGEIYFKHFLKNNVSPSVKHVSKFNGYLKKHLKKIEATHVSKKFISVLE